MPLRLHSLKTRIALTNAAAVAALFGLSGAWILGAERLERHRAAEERVARFARETAPELTAAWRAGELDARAARLLALEPNVDRLRLLGSDAEPLFDTHDGRAGDAGLSAELAEALRRPQLSVLPAQGDAGAVVAPVDLSGRRGAFVYQLSRERIQSRLRRALVSVGSATLLATLLAAALGFGFARRFTRRLDELSTAAQRIADGQLGQPLAAGARDEFGELAQRMNGMAARLQENIAELEASNRQLARANRELTEFDQLKSDLIANVSHELRTPLTAIKGYTDYMIDRKLGAISPNQEKGLQVMKRNLERLSGTVNALLDYSHLEAGRVTLNRQPFSLALLVDQVYQSLRSMVEKKGLSFASQVPEQLPEVLADREKLNQVLENLIINAVKFTPEGGRIEVAAEIQAAGNRVTVAVRDTGIGIAREQLARIFSRFHQVDGSSRRRFGGVGLGLAIVKSILDAHEAEIDVDSEPGRGSRFSFALPLAGAAAEVPGAAGPGA